MDGARFNVPLDTKCHFGDVLPSQSLSWPEVLYSLHEIFVHVTHARGSVLLCRRCSTLCTSGFIDDVIFARAIWTGIPIPSQRVTSLRRRAQANTPAAAHWLRLVRRRKAPRPDEFAVIGVSGATPAMRRILFYLGYAY